VSVGVNQKLMKAIGAKSSSPMPPAQHRFFLNEGETDVNRFVAWVWEGTIEVGHPTKGFGPRSPFRVDDKGKAKRVEDAADYFGWDHAYARRILRRAKAQGRVKTDDRRRIWLCGEVIPCEVPEEPDEADSGPDPGVDTRQQKDCTRYVPAYILLKTQNWPKAKLERFRREEGALADLYDRRLADAAAQLRAIRDQEQDTRWKQYALPERRKIDPEKKKKPAGPVTVQLKLIEVTGEEMANEKNSVQSSENGRTVQSENAASVQTSYPLVPTENYQRTTTTPDGEAPDRSEEVVVVGEKLKAYGAISKHAQKKFLESCRKASPGCTVKQILAVIDEIAQGFNRNTEHPIGVFISQVPDNIAEYRERAPVSKTYPSCPVCGEPVEGGSIQGAHFACYEKATAKTKGANR